jgi:hypothetical protein
VILEVNFSPALARWIILGVGVAITLVGWFTRDSAWAGWKKTGDGALYTRKESDVEGGWRRMQVLFLGLALVALGIFGGILADALGIQFVRVPAR